MLQRSFLRVCQAQKYDPWAVLGVPKGAPKNVLRDRYHALMQQYHPYFVKEGKGDLKKVKDIDDAYVWVTKAPSMDKRYKNLIADSSRLYYLFLPKWMAKNLEEMPRYYSWFRWKYPIGIFYAMVFGLLYFFGRLWPSHSHFVKAIVVVFAMDCLLHTSLAPIMFVALFFRLIGEQKHHSLAWLQSPKGFFRRELNY